MLEIEELSFIYQSGEIQEMKFYRKFKITKNKQSDQFIEKWSIQ